MFRRLFFLRAESAAVRLRHSGHMLPASEVGMVSAAESDEVCSVDTYDIIIIIIYLLIINYLFINNYYLLNLITLLILNSIVS